jgi:hypothetical protein
MGSVSERLSLSTSATTCSGGVFPPKPFHY